MPRIALLTVALVLSSVCARAGVVHAQERRVVEPRKEIYCAGKGQGTNDVMVRVGPLCVDKYEASVWSQPGGAGIAYTSNYPTFPATFPENGNWTVPLYAASKAEVVPTRFITWFQAQQACALSGKRLPTNAEWQMAAAGTPDPGEHGDGKTTCNTKTPSPLETGAAPACVSNWGVSDMVGNLSEWVADWMQGPGADAARVLNRWDPDKFVYASPAYGGDHIGSINEAFHDAPHSEMSPFPSAIYRGGYWGAGDGDGVFTLFAGQNPASLNNAVGFRCVKNGEAR